MIEVYVLLALGAIGYVLNATNKEQKITFTPTNPNMMKKGERPSMKDAYESKHYKTSQKIEKKKANKMFEKSKDPVKTGVIDKNFAHNNMVPFFGSHVRQNMDDKANATLMENFTGVNPLFCSKQETKSFFGPTKENIYGMPNNSDYYLGRMEAPKAQKNVLPFEQVRVGPGIGRKNGAEPVGGFQQLDSRDLVMPKCVDELRVKTNPKETYDGRILDGMKESLRGDIGEVKKNRVNRDWEQGEERWFKTTGAVLGASKEGEFNVKSTNRTDTTREYMGVAEAAVKHRKEDPSVKPTSRMQLGEYGVRNATLAREGNDGDDYGKSKIMVYGNERDLTAERVYQGNLTSLVKSIVAPFLTVAKPTIKQTTIIGNDVTNFKGHEKQTIYDPNDVARTTIKETTIHDDTIANLTGPKQLYVYDPDAVARTTMKETVDRMDYELNVSGGFQKGQAYDPDDVTRTTMKETVIDNEYEGNIDRMEGTGDYKTTDFTARNTQKQFLSDNDYYGGATQDKGRGYETNEHTARNTQKQFTSDYSYFGHADAAEGKKQKSYEDIYNAHISSRQEEILKGRAPTLSGPKVATGSDGVTITHSKSVLENRGGSQNIDPLNKMAPSMEEKTITRFKKSYEIDDRLDGSLLKAYLENPYTQPINPIIAKE
jgi:hypothetical protein